MVSVISPHENFEQLILGAKEEIERVQQSTSLLPLTSSDNVVHYSPLPWLNFTALSHATHFTHKESVPKISFGKLFEKDNRKYMSYSVHVPHALMDDYEV